MSVEVLESRARIDRARHELRRRGLSFTSSWWQDLSRRVGVSSRVGVGDYLKSWDVLRTTSFIEKNVSRSDPILDIGAFASELLYVLHHLHYSNLTGVDLNPDIKKMAYSDHVRYEVSDFMHTSFAASSFAAITAMSVIEHGFNAKVLLSEVSRLLQQRGYFIASFDYWPEKVDTTGISFFGMDWRIFSKEEVQAFLHEAAYYNLYPHGEVDLGGREKPISSANKDYTFAWLVLQKRES